MLWLLALPLLTGGCAGRARMSVGSESLTILARVDQRAVGQEVHPVAIVTLANQGGGRIGISRTHGFGSYAWLGLRIQTDVGHDLWYPEDIPDLVLRAPRYVCLHPGERIQWEIDLVDWSPEFGGERWERRLAFNLPRGEYRLQALYTDNPSWAKRAASSCPAISGAVVSEWTRFDVK